MSRYPFTSYPDGWFRVAYSHELPVGGVQPIEALGKDLVAFRGEDGRVRVLDAHCPHLGAHLGVGGTVVGNVIACPFHDWRFDGEGTCVDIPYSDRVPKKARVGAWDVQEQNGIVFVWHHHAGALPPTPSRPSAASATGGGASACTSTGAPGYTCRRWPRTRSTSRTSRRCTTT